MVGNQTFQGIRILPGNLLPPPETTVSLLLLIPVIDFRTGGRRLLKQTLASNPEIELELTGTSTQNFTSSFKKTTTINGENHAIS